MGFYNGTPMIQIGHRRVRLIVSNVCECGILHYRFTRVIEVAGFPSERDSRVAKIMFSEVYLAISFY
jgi:hypothetical protein